MTIENAHRGYRSCPFCASFAVECSRVVKSSEWMIECLTCGVVVVPQAKDRQEAIDAWNQRLTRQQEPTP